MWEKVGILRSEESLSHAKREFSAWSFILEKAFMTRRELELKNMLTVAEMIVASASSRKGSVGAHYRSDFPSKDGEWQRHITVRKEDHGLRVDS